MQDLLISRILASDEIDLRVGNGTRVAVLAVGAYVLYLSLGHVITLGDCYLVPCLTRNTIYVSSLT